MSACKDWVKASKKELKTVKGVCLDIDDTFSTDGKITPEAFNALWDLKKAGFVVVPITGRPAGWCDHIARFWPVNAVVGENGAFTFFMQDGVRKRIDTPDGLKPGEGRRKLTVLRKKISKVFPRARWASDQEYRERDLAIDICEDVKPWPRREVDRLLELCHANGAHAKLSSVHVNTWFGDYDKRTGFKFWLSNGAPGAGIKRIPKWNEWLFIGDSPNDEPMFVSFRFSVGVANLKSYLDRLHAPPVWITRRKSGMGFVEMALRLIASRSAPH